MCGAAIEVPLSVRPPVPVPASVENTPWPGAAMSGFAALSRPRGPRDENADTVSARPGVTSRTESLYSAVTATDTLETTPSVSLLLSTLPIRLVVYIAGVEALPAIVVSRNGVVSTMMIAAAPATVALFARWAEAQGNVVSCGCFQSTSRIRPLTFAASVAVKALQPYWFVAG